MPAPPLASHLEQNVEAEDGKNMEELNLVPTAVSEPRSAVHKCDNRCRAKGFKFFAIGGHCARRLTFAGIATMVGE